MRKLQHIITAALVALPMVISAQNSANPGSGPANGNSDPSVQQYGEDSNDRVYYDGKVKIIVRNINGTTVITYDSSGLNGNNPSSHGYTEDIFDVYKDIKEIEDRKRDASLRDDTGPGLKDGRDPWKLVVEGNIAGVHEPHRNGNQDFGMAPPIRLEKTGNMQENCLDCPHNNPAREFTNDITVYPNPASAFINVQLKSSELAGIRVLNMKGQQVKIASDMQQYNARIEVSDLANGVYLIEITSAGETAVKRFVKF